VFLGLGIALTLSSGSVTISLVWKLSHRLIAALVIAAWMAPGAIVFATCLHLVLEDHGHYESHHESRDEPHPESHDESGDHTRERADRAEPLVYGHHHHDLTSAPGHQHYAQVSETEPLSRPDGISTTIGPSIASFVVPPVQGSRPLRLPQRSAPPPLFVVHSSLLL